MVIYTRYFIKLTVLRNVKLILIIMYTSCLLHDSDHQVRILKTEREAEGGGGGVTSSLCSPSQNGYIK